jgi:hypothetical protein
VPARGIEPQPSNYKNAALPIELRRPYFSRSLRSQDWWHVCLTMPLRTGITTGVGSQFHILERSPPLFASVLRWSNAPSGSPSRARHRPLPCRLSKATASGRSAYWLSIFGVRETLGAA